MSTPSSTDSTPFSGSPGGVGPSLAAPENWSEALVSLVASRIALIQIESQGATRQWGKCLVSGMIAALAGVFAWALIVAGGIGALAVVTAWPWYWIALGVALLHALVAGLGVLLFKSAKTPTFPITRNEFQKDREWLQSLTTPKK